LFAKGFLGSTGAYLVGSSDPVAWRGGDGWFGFGRYTGSVSLGGRAVVVCGADF
jgi:hypothetical protein